MLSKYLLTNTLIIIGLVGSTLFTGQFWVLYYYQFIKPYGWFKPAQGKAGFLGFASLIQCFAIGFMLWLLGAWK